MKWIVLLIMTFSCLKIYSQCDSLYVISEADCIDNIESIETKLQSISHFVEELIEDQCFEAAIEQQIKKVEFCRDNYPDYVEYNSLLFFDSLLLNYSKDLSTENRNSYQIINLSAWAHFNERMGFHSRTIEKFEFLKSNLFFETNEIQDELIRSLERSFRMIGIEYFLRKEYGIAIDYLSSAVELSDQMESKMGRLSRGSTNRGNISFIYLTMNEFPGSKQIFYDHLRIAKELFKEEKETVYHLMTAYERLVQLYLLENNLDSVDYYLDFFEELEVEYKDTNYESSIFKARIMLKKEDQEEARRILISLFHNMDQKNNTTNIVNYEKNLDVSDLLIDAEMFVEAEILLDFITNKNEDRKKAGIFNDQNLYSYRNTYLFILMRKLRMNNNMDIVFLNSSMERVKEEIDYGMKNSTSRIAKLTFASLSSEFTDLFLWILTNENLNNNESIFNAIESSKAATLFKSWLQNQMNNFDHIEDLFYKEKKLEIERNRIREELNLPTKPERREELDMALKEYASTIDSIIKLLKVLYPAYYKMKYDLSIPDLTKVQEVLADDEVFINYFEGEKILYAMAITDNCSDTLKIDSVSVLRDSISQYWKNIHHEKNWTRNFSTTSNYIYQKIVAPLKDHLKERIIISPSGSLFQVPFAALNTTTEKDSFIYLIHNHAISYVPSGSFLYEIRNMNESNVVEKALLVAPDFSIDSPPKIQYAMRSELYPLECNVREAQAISKYVDHELLINEDATKKSALDLMPEVDIIHLATHAKSNMDSPEKSFVAFCKPNENMKGEEYKWYLDEISKRHLTAKMIVLSACETGLGQIYKGEGAMSLANSCFYAGAHSVVASLWSVGDSASFELMSNFYSNLSQNIPKDKAMQKAQIDYLSEYSGERANPFYWAAFSVMGNIDPLQFKNTPKYRSWVVIMFGMLALFLFLLKQFKN